MNERQKVIQLLSSPNPDSIQLGWELAAVFAKDLMQLRSFGDDVFTYKHLTIDNLQLCELLKNIGELKDVESIEAHANKIKAVPESIGQLKKLIHLDLWGNEIGSLPKSIGQLNNLTWLDLSDNRIKTLPESIGQLQKLEVLDLTTNPIPKAEQIRIYKLLPNTKVYF